MEYYSYLYNELWQRGYDAETLAPILYQNLLEQDVSVNNQTSSLETKENSIIHILNDTLDHSAPAYIEENHQFSEVLLYYYRNQDQLSKLSTFDPSFYYNSLGTTNSSLSMTYQQWTDNLLVDDGSNNSNLKLKSLGGIVAPLDHNLDDVTIDTFRCIDLSVNAASFEPSSSYTSTHSYLSSKPSFEVLPTEIVVASSSSSVSSIVVMPTVSEGNEMATEVEDFSCFETNLSFSLGYLESVLHEKVTTLPSNAITSYSDDAMELSLLLSNLDVFAAADIIIFNASSIISAKPCLHARNGGKCFRRDCMFDHDFSELTCKFWFSSGDGCALKDCPFLHGLKVPEDHHISEVQKPNSQIELTDELFPTLSSSHKSTPRKNSSSSLDSDSSSASSSTLSSLSKVSSTTTNKDFDPRTLLSFTFKKSSSVMSAVDVVNKPKNSKMKNTTPTKSSGVIVSASIKDGLSLKQHYNDMTAKKESNKVASNAWVESGETVASMYQQSREEARKLAIMRNRLLEEATRAYVAGSKDIAKNLSKQGQALNQQMKEYHLQAARKIFHSRNLKSSLMKGQIDLHGLHVSEAKICIQELIPYFRDHKIPLMTIVTGTGHHTLGPQQGLARVLPAVISVCDEWGLTYTEIKDRNGYVGGLKVKINHL